MGPAAVAMISRSVVFMAEATHSDKTLAGGVGDDDDVPRVVAPDQAEVFVGLEVAGEVV